MNRRQFIEYSGIGAAALFAPSIGRVVAAQTNIAPIPASEKKKLADIALNTATKRGATYADVRIGRYFQQFVITRETRVQNLVNTESFGAGVRVLVDGCWGFMATDQLTPDSIAKAAVEAVAIARANAKLQSEPVILAPQKGVGEVSWRTPIEKNAFEVPIADKIALLMEVNQAAMKNGANFVNSQMFAANQQKYFASTDGSYIDQDVHRIWPTFTVTSIDPKSGKFQTRRSLSAPCGRGYEYLDAKPSGKLAGVTTRYTSSYDMIEDVTAAAQQAHAKHSAKSVEPGQYDLVLDPSHLWLTIHESIGHATELDRVLGYEANYAGTSFATLDKWKSKSFKYGSPLVNIVADKKQPGSLGAVGYDDEGVPTKKWDLIKDGILVDYQKTRDQAHIVGQTESDGCSYADNWSSVQFQRMPNVSLQPGKTPLTPDEMIKNVEKGIYIIGDGSFSIDQQRYNFQFGGQLFYEIKNGAIVGPLRDVAYQSNTQEFWNSCSAICDERDYALGGAFNDGKGQPGQISSVSHGSATTRFNKVNVINTARKI
jgi:TldD protein